MSQDLQTLKSNCRKRLFDLMDQVRAKGISKFYALVGDEQTIPVVSSCFKQKDLMDNGILSVERIDQERKRLPGQAVVYILSPEPKTIEELLLDFYDDTNAYYGPVFLHFTNKVDDNAFKKIAGQSALKKRLKCFKEINLDFCLTSENQFDLNIYNDLHQIYCGNSQTKEELNKKIANQLATVVLSFPQFSNIEIFYNENQNNISQNISEQLQQRLQEDVQNLQKNQSNQISSQSGKVNVIIVDRNFDLAAPAIRDFYYQSMLYDVYDVQKDVIKFKNDKGQPRQSLLSEDQLFEQYKILHVQQALAVLQNNIDNFKENNVVAKLQARVGDLSMAEMKKMTSGLPQYKEQMGKFTQHIQFISDCIEKFEANNLEELGDIEQTILTGVNQENSKLSQKQLLSLIGKICSNQNIRQEDKYRVALLAYLQLELGQKEKDNLKGQFDDQKVFENTEKLGTNQYLNSQSKIKKINEKKKNLNESYPLLGNDQILTKTVTHLQTKCLEILEGNKDYNNSQLSSVPSGFGQIAITCVEGQEGSPKKKKKGIRDMLQKNESQVIKEANQNQGTNSKFIVFVAGGISQLEVRTVSHTFIPYDEETSLVIGSTSYTNPQDYVNKIKNITKAQKN